MSQPLSKSGRSMCLSRWPSPRKPYVVLDFHCIACARFSCVHLHLLLEARVASRLQDPLTLRFGMLGQGRGQGQGPWMRKAWSTSRPGCRKRWLSSV